eukprot:GHVH01006720.1.p1 GENE.GHVH01006720.1~~GHVH01006720.1.p1  ORF type:complete len:662 (+),score=81.77 GHVH01006720.1:205-1986(+)
MERFIATMALTGDLNQSYNSEQDYQKAYRNWCFKNTHRVISVDWAVASLKAKRIFDPSKFSFQFDAPLVSEVLDIDGVTPRDNHPPSTTPSIHHNKPSSVCDSFVYNYIPEVSFARVIPTSVNTNINFSRLQPNGMTPKQTRLLKSRGLFSCQLPLSRQMVGTFDYKSPNFEILSRKSKKEAAPRSHEGVVAQLSPMELPSVEDVPCEAVDLSMNHHVICALTSLADEYEALNETWRAMTLRRCNSKLKSLDYPLTEDNINDTSLRLGPKTKEKILEIIRTQTLSRLDSLGSSPRLKLIRLFSNIHGVGIELATRLYADGYRSIADIREALPPWFTSVQLMGLELFDDLMDRMPREESTTIALKVFEAILYLAPLQDMMNKQGDKQGNTSKYTQGSYQAGPFREDMWNNCGYEAVVCGSYRRGKSTCGDVDILIVPKSMSSCDLSDDLFMTRLVDRLTADGLITHSFVKRISSTWMGVVKLPNSGSKFRRLDLKIYPRKCSAFALLYFTGSGPFNRSMRLFSRKLGYSLSDRGLVRVIRQKGNKKMKVGSNIECSTEQSIFDAIGLDYRFPFQREVDLNWIKGIDVRLDNILT